MVLLWLRKICRPHPADTIHKGLSRATRDSKRPSSSRFTRNPCRQGTESNTNRLRRHQIPTTIRGQRTVQNPTGRQRPIERVRGLTRQDRNRRRCSDPCRRVLSERSRPPETQRYYTRSSMVRKMRRPTPSRRQALHQMRVSVRLNRLSDMSNDEPYRSKVLQELW